MAGTGQDDKPFEKHKKITGTPSVCLAKMPLWCTIRLAQIVIRSGVVICLLGVEDYLVFKKGACRRTYGEHRTSWVHWETFSVQSFF